MDQKSATNIKVAIRIRPLIPSEKERKLRTQWGIQDKLIYQIDDNGQKFGEVYSFDHIFGETKTNSDIYDDIVKDFVTSSLSGLNATIFAYGQTSSGKTYTMLGDRRNAGIMTLAIENIFNTIENDLTRKFLLRVSYIEIYNEKIHDLLDPSNKEVKIREFLTGHIGLQNVKEEIVSTKEQIYDCLKAGNLNRKIGSTKANERSSRSHAIFKIIIESQSCNENGGGGVVQVSNLNLVDLAGSERVAQTKATGIRLKEGGHINKSLSALGLVIRQLSDGQEFVNFRDSKLTRLLQDSLGGNSKTLIIAMITVTSIDETASTLAFAQRAKTVKNKPQVNEVLSDADINKRYATLNSQLQKKLEEQMVLNGKLQETQMENQREMGRLQQQIEMLAEFQYGKKSPKEESIPKRRHTIGFLSQKRLLAPLAPVAFNDSSNSLRNFGFEELSLTNMTSSIGLEPILEEETFQAPAEDVPESYLKTRLSALEEEYNELVVFTRNEKDMQNESFRNRIVELEETLEQTKLQNFQKQQALEEEWKDKFRKREEELQNKIKELEQGKEEMKTIDAEEIGHIMQQLTSLQDLLSNESRNDLRDSASGQLEFKRVLEKINRTSDIYNNNYDVLKDLLRSKMEENEGLMEEIKKIKVVEEENKQLKKELLETKKCFNEEIEKLAITREEQQQELNLKEEKMNLILKEKDGIYSENKVLKQEIVALHKMHTDDVKNLKNEIVELISDRQNTEEILNHKLNIEVEKCLKENEENLKLKQELAVQNEIIQELKLELLEKTNYCERNLSQVETELVNANEKYSNLCSENEFLKEKLENGQIDIKRFREEMIGLENQVAELLSDKESLNVENERLLQKSVAEELLKNKVLKENEELNLKIRCRDELIANFESELSKLKTESEKAGNLIKEIDRLIVEKECLMKENTRLQEEQQQNIREGVKKIKDLESNLGKLQTENNELKLQCSNKEKILTFTNSESNNIKNNINKLNLELQKLGQISKENQEKFEKESRELKQKLISQNEKLNELNVLIQEKNGLITSSESDLSKMKSEIEQMCEEINNLKNEIATLISEKEHLNRIITQCQQKHSIDERKLNNSELQIQKLKQFLDNAQTNLNNLKLAQTEKEKVKCENSMYKNQILLLNKKLEESDKLIKQLQNDNSNNSERIVNEDVNRLRDLNKTHETFLCSIMEQFINEQKKILSTRHSQSQRDCFKNVLRDLRTYNAFFKEQIRLLRNDSNFNLNEITSILMKSQSAFRDYFNLEKSLLQTQINQIECTNKKYLEEMMALKDLGKENCSQCNDLKKELQSLTGKNEALTKEKYKRLEEIVTLQNRLYDEQDRKAEVQYSEFMNFYRENNQMQNEEIERLQKRLRKYKNIPKASVEIQCNVVSTESLGKCLKCENNTEDRRQETNKLEAAIQCDIMTEKYCAMKAALVLKNEEISQLKHRISTTQTSPEHKATSLVTHTTMEVQCDIITAEKYKGLKARCIASDDQIKLLKNRITALKSSVNSK